MSNYPRFVATWAMIVLGFDALASTVSLLTELPYGWFSIGSAVIYLICSYKGAPLFGLGKAIVATVLVALVDATLGWAISWGIGPGQVSDPSLSPIAIVVSGLIIAPMFGGALGLIGGGIALKSGGH